MDVGVNMIAKVQNINTAKMYFLLHVATYNIFYNFNTQYFHGVLLVI